MTKSIPKRPRRGQDALLLGCALLYTVALALWYSAFFIPQWDSWQLQATATIGSWFFLPLWPLLLWAGGRRYWPALMILILPFALFAHDYGALFLPNPPAPRTAAAETEATAHTLRIMSWNSFYANENSAALAATVAELQPDLIAIQEFSYGLADDVRTRLADALPYQERYPTGGPSGMAILSRYPILNQSEPDFNRGTGCNCQQITIDFQGQPVTIINTHPWPPRVRLARRGRFPWVSDFSTANQDPIIDALLERIQHAPRPLLVLGDLNTSERQPNYRRLRTLLNDAFAQMGWGMGYTFPAVERIENIPIIPLLRIDYVFYDNDWRAQRAWVGHIDGSDHRYVAADLTLNP
ncbi:MAG: endonuclease/exonuclease/phosphatase family protein [Caldilineaceae bacterium]